MMIEIEQDSIVLIGLFLCILIVLNCNIVPYFLLQEKVLIRQYITKAGLAVNHQNGIRNLPCILKWYTCKNSARRRNSRVSKLKVHLFSDMGQPRVRFWEFTHSLFQEVRLRCSGRQLVEVDRRRLPARAEKSKCVRIFPGNEASFLFPFFLTLCLITWLPQS